MAIGTFAELSTAIDNWSDRTDTDLDARIPECITLGETQIFRRLRTRQMETTTSDTPNSDGEITLPSDLIEVKRVVAKTDPRAPLDYVTPEYLDSINARVAGDPQVYTIIGSTLTALPFPSADIEVVYYAKVEPLSAAAPTNWLLTRWPDIYLYASLGALAVLTHDGGGATNYFALMNQAIDAAMMEDNASRMGPAGMRVMGPVW